MADRPIIIGLLGGVASGKSSVAVFMREWGAVIIDADRISHEVLRTPEVAAAVAGIFGEEVLGTDGAPDRRRIARLVFGDEDALERLMAVLHPRIRQRIKAEIGAAGDACAVVLDAPLLYEGGLIDETDVVVFVDTDTDRRRNRTVRDRGWADDELAARESHQAPLATKRDRADFSLKNDGTREQLRDATFRLFRRILEGEKDGL